MSIVAIIPARLCSTRFPGKLLAWFDGKPVIQHIIEYVLKFDFVDKVVMATDSYELMEFASFYDLEVFFMKDTPTRCATERIYHFYKENRDYDYYLSIPSDEPIIDPNEINKVWPKILDYLPDTSNTIASLYTKFYCEEDLKSLLSCKIVTDTHNRMIYSSRAIIPFSKNRELYPLEEYKKHVGIFVFPNNYMKNYSEILWGDWKSELMDLEGLEQNRILDFGTTIRLFEIEHIGFGIDKEEQIEILEERCRL